MSHPRRLEQADIDELFNAYQEAGGGSGRYPMLWPTVSVAEVEHGYQIFEWAQHAANQGVIRQIMHDKLIEAVSPCFHDAFQWTNVYVARPRSQGTGDITRNGNLVLIVPPRRLPVGVSTKMFVIEIGCDHKTWQAEANGPSCTHYRCDDCGYTYEVDSSD